MAVRWSLVAAMILVGLAGCNSDPQQGRAFDAGALDTGADTAEQVDVAPKTELGGVCVEDAGCASDRCEKIGDAIRCTTGCSEGDGTCEGADMACVEGRCVPKGYCRDVDGDGYGAGPGCMGPDCDDENPKVNPGQDELCGNLVDDNCNNEVDEGFERLGANCSDGKGLCQVGGRIICSADRTSMECSASAKEAGKEVCDGLDNDCDGKVDNQLNCRCEVGETQRCYTGSAETRGLGICADGTQTCQEDGSWGGCTGDTLPAQEKCDGRDNSCSGVVDDVDGDGDGYWGCSGVAERDCDDSDPKVHPGASEQCNRIDDNCNGLIDENSQNVYYLDNDGDGWGMPAKQVSACNPPNNYVDKTGDCNDNNKDVYPGATEVCNDIDDDCDGRIDDGLPTVTLYKDDDGDTYGTSSGRTQTKCLYDKDNDGKGDAPPVGWSTNDTDCNDSNTTVYPDAPERCDNILNDCTAKVKDWSCPQRCGPNWPVRMKGNSGRPVPVQLDGDGALEVVATQARAETKAIEPDGTIKWTSTHASTYSTFGVADYNDDVFDVVVGSGTILDGRDGTVLARHSIASTYRGYSAFDVDGDGQTDLIPGGGYDFLLLDATLAAKSTVPMKQVNRTQILNTYPLLYDFDEDGDVEVAVGTDTKCHTTNRQKCLGRLYVYNHDGSWYNDPTWTDQSKPWFQVTPFPGTAFTTGPLRVLDVDADGDAEVVGHANHQPGGSKWWVWNTDGTVHKSSPLSEFSYPAPVKKDWTIDPSGKLRHLGGPVVDMDGDGTYEVLTTHNGQVTVQRKGQILSDSALPVGGGDPVIADLQQDGRLDVLLLTSSNTVDCYSYGRKTFDEARILHYGGTSPYERGIHQTNNIDPLEPNDPGKATFKPQNSTDPVGDSRAFDIGPFRRKLSGGANQRYRRITALIGEKGDRDFYVDGPNRHIRVWLWPTQTDLDLKLHVFDADTEKYLKTLSNPVTGAGKAEDIRCNDNVPSTNCPQGNKLFIIEVAPKNPAKDWGPFPYTLRTGR